MFGLKILFVSLLLTDANLSESLAVKKLRKEQLFERLYGYKREKTRSRMSETKITGDCTVDGPFMFPIDIFAAWENREQKKDARITIRSQSPERTNGRSKSSGGRESPVKTTFLSRNIFATRKNPSQPENREQRKDASSQKISEGALGRPKSSQGRKSPGKVPLMSRITTFKLPYRKSSDPTPLMECMLNVVKLSLPPVTLGQASDPVQNFLGIVDELSGEASATQPVAITISSDTLTSFVDVAIPCFESMKQHRAGKLVLDEDFATSAAAKTTKKRPMGELALGATEALVENVSVTYDSSGKLLFDINYIDLAFGLGMAAVRTTKIGHIATKSTEGRSWLSRSVTRITEAGSQSSTNQVALLECTLNAAISSLSDTAASDKGVSLVNNQACSTQSVLESFVKAVTPCFGLFRRNGDGKLGLGEDIIAEALKLEPMGMLAVKSADAIVASVSATCDEDGNIHYTINYTELATRLGNAVVESAAKTGQAPTIPAETRSRLNKSIGNFVWGPDPSLSCEPTPVGLATALKCVQACAVKTFEGLWLTRSIGQIIKGMGPRKRIPTNMVQILGCTSKAVLMSLFGGISRLKPKIAVTEPAGESGNLITQNVLELFVDKTTPCFAFFKRNEYGMLEIDPDFIRGTAAEALRLLPVGALVVGAIEVIVRNVEEVRDEEGKLQYKINYPGLTAGLGVVVADATSFGVVGFASDVITSFL